MFKTIKTVALSAVIGLSALAAVPATAQADSFYFGISPQGPSFGFRNDDRRPGRDWHRDDRRDGRNWRRNHRGRDDCSVRDALRKADRMGVNRARVQGENRNIIRVGGRTRGHRVNITFGKAPNCPVLSRR